MKQFLIKYRFTNGTTEEWHRQIAAFIASLNADPELKGISYRVMKIRDSADYYHLATAVDDASVKALGQRDFFKRYTEQTKHVASGEVTVSPLELIGETANS